MLKRKVILTALLVVISFALLTYQSIKGRGHYFDFTLYPLKKLEQGSSFLLGVVDHIPFIGTGDSERSLLDRLNACEKDRTRYSEAAAENERLRSLLELRSQRSDVVAAAEVFARDPTNWFQLLWINKGLVSGISKDMVAMTHLGLVGRIHRVFKGRASVIQITDVNSAVAVRLETSRIEGILEGTGEAGCILKYIPKEFEVEIGENIITSGLDGIFPEGLPVGYVSAVDREGEEIFQHIEVTPSQYMNRVEEVLILKR